MDLTSVLILTTYFSCFIPPSYALLKRVGVTAKLLRRAILFGFTLAFLQVLLPLGLLFISYDYGPYLGIAFSLIFSYLYVRHVVQLKWFQNILVIFLLPVIAGLISTPFMYAFYFMQHS